MGDLATLLTALGTFGSFGVSSIAVALQWRRSSKRERKDAAEGAAERAVDELLTALSDDGKIKPDEVAKIRDHLHHKEDGK